MAAETAAGKFDWLNMISRQPTAYDADNVVEQWEDHAIEFEAFGQCSDYVEMSHENRDCKGRWSK